MLWSIIKKLDEHVELMYNIAQKQIYYTNEVKLCIERDVDD